MRVSFLNLGDIPYLKYHPEFHGGAKVFCLKRINQLESQVGRIGLGFWTADLSFKN